MKIAKVLMVVLAVSFCCSAVNAQDDCSSAGSVSCGGSWTTDPSLDTTPGVGFTASCSVGACSGLANACFNDGHCPAGQTCGWANMDDTFAEFIAEDINARFRTDVGSVATDSEFVIYSIDQAAHCDEASWVEIGCSGDEVGYNGDISVGGLTVGDTYLIRFGHWGSATSGDYQLDVECPAPGGVCGDGETSAAGDEECDGDDVDNCEVSCEADCTCTPDVCGNGIQHGAEECDGADTGDCLLTCEADCTCTPVPTPMLPKWGLIGLATMLLVGGVAVFGRGQMGVQQV